MGKSFDVLADFGSGPLKIASAKTNGGGWWIAPQGEDGEHYSFPPDGRRHWTEPKTGRHDFLKPAPPFSDLTMASWFVLDIKHDAPPEWAKPQSAGPRSFVIPSTTSGGKLHAAVVDERYADKLEEALKAADPSITTFRCSSEGPQRVVWAWAPNTK